MLKAKQSVMLQDSLDYMDKIINLRITSINRSFLSMFEDDNFIKLVARSKKSDNSVFDEIMLQNEFKNYLSRFSAVDNDILQSIMLITNDGKVFSDSYQPQYGYSDFINTKYFKSAMLNKNKLLFVNNSMQDKYFAIVRSFYYVGEGLSESYSPGIGSEEDKDYCTMVFLLKKSYVEELINKVAQRQESDIVILDEGNNEVLKVLQQNGEGRIDYTELLRKSIKGESGNLATSSNNKNFFVSYKEIKYSSWRIVMIFDEKLLLKDAGSLLKSVEYIVFIALLLVIIMGYFLANTIVKPIQKLISIMDSTVENDMGITYKTKYNDEIALLGKAFNVMIMKIREMVKQIQKEERLIREGELKALQAQINPHFLYNTLDMVYMMAKVDKNDKIADLIADLGDFFRLSLNKGEDITTVGKEIEHVKRYLSIQSVRMNNKFTYKIYSQEDILKKHVPKLILQPIVENSLMHGFINIDYLGEISIKVYSEEEKIIFKIEDNGKGLEQDIIEKINSGAELNKGKSGYAIKNIYERLKIYNGMEHMLNFENRAEGGTRVTLKFPIDFKSNDINKLS
jgi:two-component system sensor histidine kinase YesM